VIRLTSRVQGALLGFGGIAIVTVVFVAFGRSAPHAIPAMVLLVPITIASVVSDWRVAVPVAIASACVYALVFIPPIGGVHIEVAEDAFVLVTFVVVAVIVSALKGPRSRPVDTEFIDNRRAVLLRGVSHDLRAPLTTIRAISTELLDGGGNYDDGTRNQLLGRVVDESDRLDRIVGNLLSVSRVQAGALIPNLEPESVEHLIYRSAGRLNRSGTHEIVADVDPDLPEISADAVQIDQVLTNLIENSLKHSPADSTIRIEARAAQPSEGVADFVEITVSDSGPGFSPEARTSLFQPFHALGQTSTGLGLAVCKAIVEAHGGTIEVRDEPSRGAHVRFTLRAYRDAGDHPAGGG
jgi:K+-sensing histidine kinase KdpD